MRVPKLEMHLAHSCNLRCQSCSHYANYQLSGILPFAQGSFWLRTWAERIEPVRFSFLGGEPLLNEEVNKFLRLARRLWPVTEIRLVTNGLLLQRCTAPFWSTLSETSTLVTVSIHSSDPSYQNKLLQNLKCLQENAEKYNFRWEKRNSISNWYRLYRGVGEQMTPFTDGNPHKSWQACQNKHCVTLQDNALWKCPPAAHLPRVAAKFKLGQKPCWNIPLQYKPLTLDASDDQVRHFFAQQEEPICGMCPATLEYFEKSIYQSDIEASKTAKNSAN